MNRATLSILEVLNRRRLVRRNFLTDYVGLNEQNTRTLIANLNTLGHLHRYPYDGNGRPEFSYPSKFFYIYSKGAQADRALKMAGINPIKHPDIGQQFWHQMFIDDILLSIEIACEEYGLTFTDQYKILGDKPLELPCHFSRLINGKMHTSDRALAPDALFAVNGTYFALEADRDTEPVERSNLQQTSYLRKFLQYRDILKNKTYKTEWDVPNLMVLHISTRQERTEALMAYMLKLGAKSESQCFKSAPSLSSTLKSPTPLMTLVTDPYQRVGYEPYIINSEVHRHERTSKTDGTVHGAGFTFRAN